MFTNTCRRKIPEITQEEDKTLYISTELFAEKNFVKPASVRSRYCLYGSYFGVVPKKLRNGKLAWPPLIQDELAHDREVSI